MRWQIEMNGNGKRYPKQCFLLWITDGLWHESDYCFLQIYREIDRRNDLCWTTICADSYTNMSNHKVGSHNPTSSGDFEVPRHHADRVLITARTFSSVEDEKWRDGDEKANTHQPVKRPKELFVINHNLIVRNKSPTLIAGWEGVGPRMNGQRRMGFQSLIVTIYLFPCPEIRKRVLKLWIIPQIGIACLIYCRFSLFIMGTLYDRPSPPPWRNIVNLWQLPSNYNHLPYQVGRTRGLFNYEKILSTTFSHSHDYTD